LRIGLDPSGAEPADRQRPHAGSLRASRTARCAPSCSHWFPQPHLHPNLASRIQPRPSCAFRHDVTLRLRGPVGEGVENTWRCSSLHTSRMDCGLSGVVLVTSDAHRGLTEAIGTTAPGAAWRRCRTHYAANRCRSPPKSACGWVRALLHSVYDPARRGFTHHTAGRDRMRHKLRQSQWIGATLPSLR
jgi:hypothetical protein